MDPIIHIHIINASALNITRMGSKICKFKYSNCRPRLAALARVAKAPKM
jgi:hypothetical protein